MRRGSFSSMNAACSVRNYLASSSLPGLIVHVPTYTNGVLTSGLLSYS
jgi:hypothetical protein